jgi:hypothetical protein
MVRQQQAQAITPQPAGVHIGTEAFAVAGTNEPYILTWIKDADCDPVVGL